MPKGTTIRAVEPAYTKTPGRKEGVTYKDGIVYGVAPDCGKATCTLTFKHGHPTAPLAPAVIDFAQAVQAQAAHSFPKGWAKADAATLGSYAIAFLDEGLGHGGETPSESAEALAAVAAYAMALRDKLLNTRFGRL
jgi:hypothetical protein